MKILHLTDFHFNSKNIQRQEKLIDKIISSVRSEKIDFIFFTGDLVDKGGNSGKLFRHAYDTLFKPLIQNGIIHENNIFICCGNHDINRDLDLISSRTHLDSITSIESLNDFVLKNREEFEISLRKLKPFANFHKSLSWDDKDYIDNLFSIHYRLVGEKKIGIATINSSWRAFDSNSDKGKLLFPPIFIENIIEKLKNTDIKFILTHHPLADFKDFVLYENERLIYNNFHFLFSGHTHTEKLETHLTSDEGIFSCVSPSTLTFSQSNNTIGYTLVDIDEENIHSANVTKFVYERNSETVYRGNAICVRVPISSDKEELLKLRDSIRDQYRTEKEIANELLVSAQQAGNNPKDFLQLFAPPALKSKSVSQITIGTESIPSVDLSSLVSSSKNYLIFGKSKSGRTSILYKILLDCLSNFSHYKALPLYLNGKEVKLNRNNEIDYVTLLARKYGFTKGNILNILKNYRLILLIDNYSGDLFGFNSAINRIVGEGASVVICQEDSVTKDYSEDEAFDFNYDKLYIHDISRSHIRSLVKKWPNLPVQSSDIILDKLLKVFKQLHISCNYWTVSLFLWLFEKTNNISLNNDIELIQLYVDELLDKAGLATNRSIKIKFEELKDYLGELAMYLLNNHGEYWYSARYEDIVSFTSEYTKRNIRFVVSVEDMMSLLTNKGIMKKTYNDRYTFRLNGVFEYFVAIYIKNNRIYRENLIFDNNYLSFANELELYAGFEGKDKEFVETILFRTEGIYESVNKKYGSESDIDRGLINKLESMLKINISINNLHQNYEKGLIALTEEEADEVMDEMFPVSKTAEDVRAKEFVAEIQPTVNNLERSLKILARVFRNSSLDDVEFSNKVLDFILLSACHMGFSVLDDLDEDMSRNESKYDNDQYRMIVDITTRFMPLLVSTFLVEALAQDNLERLIREKIRKLDSNVDQLQIMLLYFLLIDLNPTKNIDAINELIDSISLGVLRHGILLKLYMYVIFYSYNNSKFSTSIKESIRRLHLLIDPKSKNKVDKTIENLSRKSMIENRINTIRG